MGDRVRGFSIGLLVGAVLFPHVLVPYHNHVLDRGGWQCTAYDTGSVLDPKRCIQYGLKGD